MDRIIKLGIVGTGAIADVHAACIDEIPNATLVALSSSSAERAKQAQARFSQPIYADYKTMMSEEDMDIVIICTQSGAHLSATTEAAKQGIHVLSEKPLEVTIERANSMISACRNANVKLGCIFQNRFSPDFVALKEAVDKGHLGKLLMGNASINWYRDADYYANSPWRGTMEGDGGAALINQGIHTIDLLQYLMGDVNSVFGKIKTNVHNIEGEDTATALLTFADGAMGTVTGGTSLYPGYPERLEVFGEKGSVILEAGKIVAWNVPGHERDVKEPAKGNGSGASDPMAIGNALHKAQIEDMIDAVLNDREPVVNGEEGLKSLALIKGIYRSAELGVEVSV